MGIRAGRPLRHPWHWERLASLIKGVYIYFIDPGTERRFRSTLPEPNDRPLIRHGKGDITHSSQ